MPRPRNPGRDALGGSINNFKRSQAEVSDILAAVEAKIGALARDPAIYRRGVRRKSRWSSRSPAALDHDCASGG